MLGPGNGGRIQARFSGPDHDKVREFAVQAMNVIRQDGGGKGIRLDCREQVKVLRPQFLEAEARRASITRTDLAQSLESTFSGRRIGIFRENDELIPILLRSPYHERSDPDSIRDVQVFSAATGSFVPIRQVVSDFTLENEDPILMRRNRQSTITVHADPMEGLPRALVRARAPADRGHSAAARLQAGMGRRIRGLRQGAGRAGRHAADLPADDGADRSNPFQLDQNDAHHLDHRALRLDRHRGADCWSPASPSASWPCSARSAFPACSSRTASCLIDEIRLQINSGKAPWNAVVDASVSRVRPVSMAALTTVLGLDPAALRRVLRGDGRDGDGGPAVRHGPDADRGAGALCDFLPLPAGHATGSSVNSNCGLPPSARAVENHTTGNRLAQRCQMIPPVFRFGRDHRHFADQTGNRRMAASPVGPFKSAARTASTLAPVSSARRAISSITP